MTKPNQSDPPQGDTPQGRREFLNLAIAGTATALGGAAAYPALSLLAPVERSAPREVTAGEEAKFDVGSGRTVLIGALAALVIRLPDGEFRAFSAVCTHLDCIVHYSAERHRIECPCHSGVFDLDGTNVSGPPPRPLTPLHVTVRAGRVVVSET